MSRFVNEVIIDIRRGRETWRVFVALCIPSGIASLALALV